MQITTLNLPLVYEHAFPGPDHYLVVHRSDYYTPGRFLRELRDIYPASPREEIWARPSWFILDIQSPGGSLGAFALVLTYGSGLTTSKGPRRLRPITRKSISQ